jgi:vacuolar-type H+-ATPase subunit I/STV1
LFLTKHYGDANGQKKNISGNKMAEKVSLDMQIKRLEKNMGTIVKAFKELKVSMDALEKKVNKHQEEEIQELIKTQKVLNDIVLSNSEEIKQVDIKIKQLENKNEATKVYSKEDTDDTRAIKAKKCKYYNRGYCKSKFKCKFVHHRESCKIYLEGKSCDDKNCKDRHSKVCKWWLQGGCRGRNCDNLHVTLVHDDDKQKDAYKNFPCHGCKNCYDDRTCVVQHSTAPVSKL